ncbi:hypothetical protein HBI98_22335 [Aeromonas veronii]|nr:hypothetical protein [Aeromonas veronii]
MGIRNKAACGKFNLMYLCLILLVTVCVQGAPAKRGRSNPKSRTKLAGEDTNWLRKTRGGPSVPLLPPDEELGLKVRLAESEEVEVSGDGEAAMGKDFISGDDEIPLHIPIPVQKPHLPKGQAE